MEYKRFGNTVVVRMDKGEEIVEQVKQVALKENIKLAQVSALGCLLYTSFAGKRSAEHHRRYGNCRLCF